MKKLGLSAWIMLISLSTCIQAEESSFNYLSADVAPSYQPQEEVEAGFWMQVDKVEQKIKNSPSLITDPELNAYLGDMVCRLAKNYCDDIRLYIVRQPYFNASMYPNGMMVVWTGLLLRVENEDQLAAVLGHEIGHYLKRHTMKRFLDAKGKSSTSAFLSIGLAVAGVGILSLATDAMLAGSIFANSRDDEHEADKYGMQLMHEAGYDVYQASPIWNNLIKEDQAAKKEGEDKNDGKGGFFSTHPLPEDRSVNLQTYAEQLQQQKADTTARNEQYQQLIHQHIYSFLNDQMLLNEPEKSEYLLNELKKKGKNLGVINYFEGELFRVRKQEGDLKKAENAYLKALDYEDAPVQTYRDLGIVFLKQKNMVKAKQYLQDYLSMNAEAKDSQMIEYYLSMEI
jgi:predicted Zn-dependent protease